ncbi:class I SAM-dependent methyltransferase [Thermaurantiacus sp.]|uniref:class I SAM-dependent methyltransferase n=1 Tax=Thermaurantiacus sp. TaxID=2820283 RepID=UPI00298F2479|nr:class I SAM-dependent methyltransferase [Thermaurantiacus sp.]
MSDNADQIAFWNGQAGATWAALADRLDRQIEAVGEAALAALGPTPGERILDVGCGCGATSIALARRVVPGGEVVGVDVSEPMLAVARRRGAGVPGLSFQEGDASAMAFGSPFDAIFSRFGVMFFARPVEAFAHLRQGLKPDGRMAFVCWQGLERNDWMRRPLEAALPHLPPPAPPDPQAPGPFALADPDRLGAILRQAGFRSIRLVAWEGELGAQPLGEAVELSLRLGPLGRALQENPDRHEAVARAVSAALAAEADAMGWVRPRAAAWIVTARAS